MCRNIRPLFNFEPPASDEEIRAAALQFVRKVSGQQRPSSANAPAFEEAIDEIADATHRLLARMTTTRPPKNRDIEAEKAKARSRRRFG